MGAQDLDEVALFGDKDNNERRGDDSSTRGNLALHERLFLAGFMVTETNGPIVWIYVRILPEIRNVAEQVTQVFGIH